MKAQFIKKSFCLMITLIMVIGLLPAGILNVAADTSDATKTEYVKVNSPDEIIPNQRYIIIGKYTDAEGEVSYHAMGTQNSRYDGYRYSYAQDQNGTHHFDISDDLNNVTVYSYETYDPILRVRLRPVNNSYGDCYRFEVDSQKYLYGFSTSYSVGTTGHSAHSCMPINTYTAGESWWRVAVGTNGQWKIATRWRPSRVYEHVMMGFYGPYPNSGAQFRSRPAGLVAPDTGESPTIVHIEEKETNIYLYREICSHHSADVTHRPFVAAACNAPGTAEHWYCAGCESYYSNASCTTKMPLEKTFLPSPSHNFAKKVCKNCYSPLTEGLFEEYKDSISFSSSDSGKRYLLVGKKGNDLYVMGNTANADGSRNAVKVTPDQYGRVSTNDQAVEILTYNYANGTSGFLVDGGYLALLNGSIIAFEESREDDRGMPTEGYFNDYDYYDETGLGYLSSYTTLNSYKEEYLVFDEENLCFTVSDEESNTLILYREVCDHEGLVHNPAADPTCMEQGSKEYWYCEDCYKYFSDESLTETIKIPEYGNPDDFFTLAAKKHDYNESGICKNCSMKKPVYSKITSEEQLDSLGENASFILVVKDGDKAYTAVTTPDNPFEIDSDGDGRVDAYDIDENGNGHPDCFEFDYDENGTYDYLEDRNGDGEVNDYDAEDLLWELSYTYDEQFWDLPNNMEITIANNDTVTLSNSEAMEFSMIELGQIDGGMEASEGEGLEAASNTQKLMAFCIPNYWITANDMGYYGKGHFNKQNANSPESGNWVISFNADGSLRALNEWESYDETAALTMWVWTYTDSETGETVTDRTFVNIAEWLWENGPIPEGGTKTAMLPVYLYGYKPEYITPPHVHTWDEGVLYRAPKIYNDGKIKFTCTGCDAVRYESLGYLVAVEEIVNEELDVKLQIDEESAAAIDEQTKLKVKKFSDTELKAIDQGTVTDIIGIFGSGAGIVSAYDISLMYGTKEVQPDGNVIVTLPAPENYELLEDIQVVYINDEGGVIPYETTVNPDGTISFVTDHFSCYAITARSESTNTYNITLNISGWLNAADSVTVTVTDTASGTVVSENTVLGNVNTYTTSVSSTGSYKVAVKSPKYETVTKTISVGESGATEAIALKAIFRIAAASLSLQENISINFKAVGEAFTAYGYTDPYLLVTVNGEETKLDTWTVERSTGRYVFKFNRIAPNMIGDSVSAVLYAKDSNGTLVQSQTINYGVKTYCQSQLKKSIADSFRTVIVDLLNYGAAAQNYTSYKTNDLANAFLQEDAYKSNLAYATKTLDLSSFNGVAKSNYETVANPKVQMHGANLTLSDSVTIRFIVSVLNVSDFEGLKIQISKADGSYTWEFDATDESVVEFYKAQDGRQRYYVRFKELNATEMSDVIYLKFVDSNGNPVSNTLRYSIGCYAYSKQNDTTTPGLAEMVKAMMKYGNATKAWNS